MSLLRPRLAEAPRAGLVFIAITVCLDVVSQSITFPILPQLTLQLLHGDRPGAARWVGVLEAAWAIAQFFAAPVLGMLSDRFGRRPVIVLSVFGVAAEFVMCAFAPTIGWLMAARVLCGLTCGAQAAAMAYVADVTPPEARTKSYGWLNAAAWTGVILGPALGGLLAVVGIRAPFWAAAAFALANGVYGFFVLPESLPAKDRAPIRWSKANPWGALSLMLQRPGLPALGLVLLLLWFAAYAMNSVFVLYTSYRFGWDPLALGIFCSALAVANIAVQTGLAGRIAEMIGERRAVISGLALQTLGFVLVGFAPNGALFWAANLPIALGGVAGPALQSLMTAKVGPDEQGRLQGATGAVGSLTGFMGPVAFTQVFAWTVALNRGPGWSGLTILMGAALSLAAWALVVGFTRDGPTAASTP
jgi:DHA1 family tetracycline resistance protein-like MFS transporter